MENVLKSMDEHTKGLQKKLTTDIDNFNISKELAAIKCDLEIELNLDHARWTFDEPDFKLKCAELGLKPMNLNFLVNN